MVRAEVMAAVMAAVVRAEVRVGVGRLMPIYRQVGYGGSLWFIHNLWITLAELI